MFTDGWVAWSRWCFRPTIVADTVLHVRDFAESRKKLKRPPKKATLFLNPFEPV